MVFLMVLFVTIFSGCLSEARDGPVLPEVQESEIDAENELETGLPAEGSPVILIEAPEGICVRETKILGDKVIIYLENIDSERIFVSKIGADVSYDTDLTKVEHFEKEMNTFIEPGRTKPVTIKVRILNDWQDAGITKIEVSP
jgi:hypothetical protein